MANTQLKNDVVHWEDIRVANSAGTFEPVPSGDTFSAVSSDPTNLNVEIGTHPQTGNPARKVNALHQGPFTGITVTVSDTSGLSPWVEMFDIVVDVTPVDIAGDPSSVFEESQPLPPA